MRLRRRIIGAAELLDDDTFGPNGSELGVLQGLVRLSYARVVPSVLRLFQTTLSGDDPRPERGPADGGLAAPL